MARSTCFSTSAVGLLPLLSSTAALESWPVARTGPCGCARVDHTRPPASGLTLRRQPPRLHQRLGSCGPTWQIPTLGMSARDSEPCTRLGHQERSPADPQIHGSGPPFLMAHATPESPSTTSSRGRPLSRLLGTLLPQSPHL